MRAMDREDKRNLYLVGQERLLIAFIECIASFFEDSDGPFVLTHPNIDVQNFIVSLEGELLGIIDWDGVSAAPKCLGNRKYPGWLTRDWNPGMHGYGSYGVRDDPCKREDSPQTLSRYRKVYCNAMRQVLQAQTKDVGVSAGQGSIGI